MRLSALALIGVLTASAALADPSPFMPPAPVDLSKPFNTRSPWRLVATQDPQTEDYGGEPAPGSLHLCLEKGGPAGPCDAAPFVAPKPAVAPTVDWGPHYLTSATPVYPRGKTAPPLLDVVTASLHAGDTGQMVVTQLLKYDPARDAFERIYRHETGTNNSEQTRFIETGPLKGAMISAEPTSKAPFGFWVTVNRFTPEQTYAQVLRYRSATRYNDGNPLAVIDSEMPNIEQRLGLWKPGSPLPLPANKACPSPHLKRSELWCS